MHDEAKARAGLADLAMQSGPMLASGYHGALLRVAGWYFPVEVSRPGLRQSSQRGSQQTAPRPLWISAYDNANMESPGAG